MRKILSILLVFSFIAPFWISFGMLNYQQKTAKKVAKWTILRGLPDEELTFLEFSKEETKTVLKWKHSKEFEFSGIMYDIVRSYESADSVHYYCWADTDETLIVQKIRILLGKENDPTDKDFSRILNLMLTGLYPPGELNEYRPEYKDQPYCLPEFTWISHFKKPSIPPPKALFLV